MIDDQLMLDLLPVVVPNGPPARVNGKNGQGRYPADLSDLDFAAAEKALADEAPGVGELAKPCRCDGAVKPSFEDDGLGRRCLSCGRRVQ